MVIKLYCSAHIKANNMTIRYFVSEITVRVYVYVYVCMCAWICLICAYVPEIA